MLVKRRPGSQCCKSPMSRLLSRSGPLPLFSAHDCTHKLECIMQAKPRSNSQPCCFVSLWQINLSCGFVRLCVHAAPTAPVNHRCRFLNELRWEMRAYLIWSLRESIRPLYHCITHTQNGEKVAIPAIRQILLNAHTPPACIKTSRDKDRNKNTDAYVHTCTVPGYILLQQCSSAFKWTLYLHHS